MRPIPAPAAARLGTFSTSEALAAGWTSDQLRGAVRRGQLVRARAGVYTLPCSATAEQFALARAQLSKSGIAAALANPMSAISHTTAAVLYDLPQWFLPETPCLTVPPAYVGDIEGCHLHRAALPSRHVGTARGAAVTSPARTVVDVGREHGVLGALVTADAALHTAMVDERELRAALRDCRGWPGVRAARIAIGFADGLAESPLESASRYKLHGKVPAPKLQRRIYASDGRFLGRTDFLWDEFGVVGEADGMAKYDDDRRLSLREEKLRQERLERAGLIVVRWVRRDLDDIDALVARLLSAFAAGRRNRDRWRWTAVPSPPPSGALHL